MKISGHVSLAMALLLLQACSGGNDNPPAPNASAPAAAAENAASASPVVAADVSNVSSARVFIVSPADGATVGSPVTVVFGIENFGLAPAGTFEPDTGHHHLLIDTTLPPLNQPIPADANHLHFGKAQTEAVVELTPGQHTLQLVLGDGYHVPHDPALISTPVTINVTASAEAVE
jgi:Domain of unknown function (DUF4399)